MPVTYTTKDSSLARPDESKRPLHTYHNAIEQRLDDGIKLHGLTGKGNGIRRITVSDELSESAKSDVADYLKTGIELVANDQ